jgi:hypothetical protein
MAHPRRAPRAPLQEALLAARQSRFRGSPGSDTSLAALSIQKILEDN